MFAVNWRGQFAAIRAFAPMLKVSGDGLIVNISSIAALNGAGSNIAYGAAKAGIDVMGKSLAHALAPEVRVMTVSPGVVATGFVPGRGAEFNEKAAASTPLKRVATAEDVAERCLLARRIFPIRPARRSSSTAAGLCKICSALALTKTLRELTKCTCRATKSSSPVR